MERNTRATTLLPHIITIMYHRIDAVNTNPWGICVSPERFEEQVSFLKKNFTVITTKEVINEVKTGSIIKNSICLTFDDGYADNYNNAKPILQKYNCPATFFIPTAFINKNKPFWWDELEMIFLYSEQLPAYLSLSFNGIKKNYTHIETELPEEQWQQHKQWKWYEQPPTNRCAVFLNIWKTLRPLPFDEIQKQMGLLREWAGSNQYTTHRLPMSEQQLGNLAENNLFTIGLHTHTHIDFIAKEKEIQIEEIAACKNHLRNTYNIESNCLAYPYGRYDTTTLEAVAELKLDGCFTTEAIAITERSQVAMLGRFQAGNWEANRFKDELSVWNNQP